MTESIADLIGRYWNAETLTRGQRSMLARLRKDASAQERAQIAAILEQARPVTVQASESQKQQRREAKRTQSREVLDRRLAQLDSDGARTRWRSELLAAASKARAMDPRGVVNLLGSDVPEKVTAGAAEQAVAALRASSPVIFSTDHRP